MDFSAWSPSHTLLLLVTLLAIGAQLVAVLTSLKINTKRLGDSVDKIDTKLDVVQSEIRKEIRDVREELRGEIQGVREELRTEIHGVRDELRGEIQGVRGEIADVRTEMNQQIGSVREELSKMNQNHIDHLTRHDS